VYTVLCALNRQPQGHFAAKAKTERVRERANTVCRCMVAMRGVWMLQYGWKLSRDSGKQFDLVEMPNLSPVSQRQAHLELIIDEVGAII
jgi:hypothetical protein